MSQPPKEDALEALAARRWRVAASLTAAMMVAYFGFILLVAFDKPLIGRLIAPGPVASASSWARSSSSPAWVPHRHLRRSGPTATTTARSTRIGR